MIARLRQWWTTPQPYDLGRLLCTLVAWILFVVALTGLLVLEYGRPPAQVPTRTGPP